MSCENCKCKEEVVVEETEQSYQTERLENRVIELEKCIFALNYFLSKKFEELRDGDFVLPVLSWYNSVQRELQDERELKFIINQLTNKGYKVIPSEK